MKLNITLHLPNRFDAIPPNYYHGTHGVLVLYDCCSVNSFHHAQDWYHKARNCISEINPDRDENIIMPMMLIGNKVDLKEEAVNYRQFPVSSNFF